MFKTLENKRKTFHNFLYFFYIFRPFFHLNHFVAIFKVLWATQILILYLAWVIFQSIKLKEKRLQNFSSFYFLVYTLVEEFQKLKSIILRVSNWKSSICFLKDFFFNLYVPFVMTESKRFWTFEQLKIHNFTNSL